MHLKFILIVCALGGTWAASCPPAQDIAPCSCEEGNLRFYCGSRTSDGPEWDIKAYFDRISPLIPSDLVFADILITSTNLVTIPAEAIKTVKFNMITIEHNQKLTYIHPDAFGETTNVTTYLSISENSYLTNEGEGHTERDLYDVISKFKAAAEISIHHNRIKSIPDEGFGPLPNLRRFRLGSGVILRVGSRAFSQLPSLEFAELGSCDISLEDIADDAFEGVGTNAVIELDRNPFSRLPEVPFKPLLDSGSGVVVGGENCNWIWCNDIPLDCDEQAAWMCENVEKYQPKVTGFVCRSDYANIWDYCAGNVNTNQIMDGN